MLESIRIYAAMGWPLHPVNAHTKAPMLTAWQSLATTDCRQIEEWAKQFPGCAWGSPTSAERAVLDVDPRHSGDKHLDDLLAKHGSLPPTPKVLTGGLGNHFWLKFPPGTAGRSIARSNINPEADSITLKAIGGQVVVPPSRIAIPEHGGRSYVWIEGCRPWELAVPDAPAWLVDYWPAKSKSKAKAKTNSQEPANPWVVQEATPDLLTHPGADKSKGEKRRPLLLQMAGVHLARGDSKASIMAMAEAWASRCKPPLEREEWLPHVERLWAKEEAKTGRMTPALPLPPPASPDSSAEPASELTISPTGHGEADAESKLDSSQSHGEADASALVNKFDSSQSGADAEALAVPDGQRETASVESFDKPTLSAEAYYGLLGEMLKAIEPETEADLAGILLCWLVILGNIIGRGAWIQVGPDLHHPALYVGIVGPTSARKGMGYSVARWPFVRTDPTWAKRSVCNGVGSGQGLIEKVRDESRTMKLNRKTGVAEEIVIPGAADKRCLLRIDELAVCFKLQRSDSSTLGETLITAWGGTDMDLPNRSGNDLRASGYSIAVIGDTQPKTLAKLLEKGVESYNGWLNRFLWVCVESLQSLPSGGNIKVLQPFLERLQAAVDFAKAAGELRMDAEAEAVYKDVYDGLKRSGDAIPHTERAAPYVLRLATLYALADSSGIIRQEHLRAALAVWVYCREVLVYRGEGLRQVGYGEDNADGAKRPIAPQCCGVVLVIP